MRPKDLSEFSGIVISALDSYLCDGFLPLCQQYFRSLVHPVFLQILVNRLSVDAFEALLQCSHIFYFSEFYIGNMFFHILYIEFSCSFFI